MPLAQETSATLKVEIPYRALAQTPLQKWSERWGISLKVIRGRVTSDRARYELEIRGAAANVARIVQQLAPWDASRRLLQPAPTKAPA